MVDSTPNVKDLTGEEILADLPELFAIGKQASAAFSGPPPDTVVGWVVKLGFAEGGVVHAAASMLDGLHATGPVTVETVAKLLGITPEGLMAKTTSLATKVIAQAQD